MNPSRSLYALMAVLSVITGLLIFFFAHGGFVRNYGGDIVAIVFLYSVLRFTLRPKPIIAAAVVMAVAIVVEVIQALIVFPDSAITALTVGTTFDPWDLLIYGLTAVSLYAFDSGLRTPPATTSVT